MSQLHRASRRRGEVAMARELFIQGKQTEPKDRRLVE